MRRGMVVAAACILALMTAGSALASGYLSVTSTPDGAAIKVNGMARGETPLFLVLAAGTYKVEASLKDFDTVTQNVQVADDEVTKFAFILPKTKVTIPMAPVAVTPTKGSLTVLTDWPNAEIYLDGVKTVLATPATIKDLAAGSYNLILINRGYALPRTVSVTAGKTTVINESFEDYKKVLAQPKPDPAKIAADTAKLRELLPGKMVVSLEPIPAKTVGSGIFAEAETYDLTFEYRKKGAADWKTTVLPWSAQTETAIVLDKGSYDVKLTATQYRQPTGLITVVTESRRRKTGDSKASLTQDIKADTQHTLVLAYSAQNGITAKTSEQPMSTAITP